ncbi:MAG TPA: hypothetical protein VKZ60_07745 [Chloroflexota bacterium]|jgi:hypothetical protein|nr:hypothetical protein [Chloroflexota bacterium]
MDDRSAPRRPPPGDRGSTEAPSPSSPAPGYGPLGEGTPVVRPQATRPPLYARQPPVWRRTAAVVVGLLCLVVAAYWLDWPQALALWVLFSAFVLLWPAYPPLTSGEERARAWPFDQ